MARACERARLQALTFHELRHTYASFLLNQGMPLSFVAKQLGHTSTQMVEKYYGHICEDALTAAIQKLPDQTELVDPMATAG